MRFALLGFALCTIIPLRPARSQTEPATPPASGVTVETGRCFRGQPKPRCNRFWLTEFGVATPILANSRYGDGQFVTWELGRMANVGRQQAVGVALFAQFGSEADGVGVRPRWRSWRKDGMSVDFAPGIYFAGSGNTPTLSGHVALNFSDYVAATVHIVTIRQQTPGFDVISKDWTMHPVSHTAIYAGARLGSKPGIISGIGFPVLAVVGLFLICSSGGCID